MNKHNSRSILFIISIVFIFVHTSCYTQKDNTIKENTDITNQNDMATKEVLTETDIRLYLYEKYHPGTCYGMPQVIDDKVVEMTLKRNPNMVKIIRDRFKPQRDFQVYEIMKSMESFSLKKTEQGYEFSFSDGKCCEVTDYTGILYIKDNKISESKILTKEAKNVPC